MSSVWGNRLLQFLSLPTVCVLGRYRSGVGSLERQMTSCKAGSMGSELFLLGRIYSGKNTDTPKGGPEKMKDSKFICQQSRQGLGWERQCSTKPFHQPPVRFRWFAMEGDKFALWEESPPRIWCTLISPSQTGNLIRLWTVSRGNWLLKTVSVEKHCVLFKGSICFLRGRESLWLLKLVCLLSERLPPRFPHLQHLT